MLPDASDSLTHTAGTRLCHDVLASSFLGRDVELSVLLPPAGLAAASTYPVLYLNDGQDLERLHFQATLDALYARQAVRPFVVVAPHANERRTQEYGTAAHPDFNGRGSLAGAYTEFVLHELLRFAQATYQASADPAEAVMAGFSLGGLTAFDLVWHHPEAFTRAGAFSGSFWWRHRAMDAGYTPQDRIMHGLVRAGTLHPQHRFWLQTGTLDERNDRNENGVIDSVEDCLDIIEELIKAGLDPQRALRYVQIEGGRHHQDTWSRIMPDFLVWAFGHPAATTTLPAPLPVVRLQFETEAASQPAHTPEPEAQDTEEASAPALLVAELAPEVQPEPLTADFIDHTPTALMTFTRPVEGDFLPYAGNYINLVSEDADPRAALRAQAEQIHAVFANLTEEQAEKGYAPGKWSLKEMLLHQIDTERIFAYRALRFSRGDSQDLHGFDQDEYVANSDANARSVANLLAEYDAVRASTIALADSFTEEQLNRRGTANNGPATVRALVYIMAGHELHHLNIIRERYLPIL